MSENKNFFNWARPPNSRYSKRHRPEGRFDIHSSKFWTWNHKS